MNFKNIMVAINTHDQRRFVLDEAIKLAKSNDANLTLVDVVPNFSWLVRMTMPGQDEVLEALQRDKQQSLEKLVNEIEGLNGNVAYKVLQGHTSMELIKEALRGKHDLVVRAAKGSASNNPGTFGTTGMRLLRKCPCAVWLMRDDLTPEFKHVLACVDTTSDDDADRELNAQIVDLAQAAKDHFSSRLSVVHAWSIWNEQMLKGRMRSEQFEKFEEQSRASVKKHFDEFLESKNMDVTDENVHLFKGEIANVISEFVDVKEVDLIVMGTVARSGVLGVLMGNTAEKILNEIKCSVLAIKPDSFVCPISVD